MEPTVRCAPYARRFTLVVGLPLAVVANFLGWAMLTAATPRSPQGVRDRGTTAASQTRHEYPVHAGIVATTFWVGEIFDPNAADGRQVVSTYDSSWEAHYGGCDGVTSSGGCATEKRFAPTFFPLHMKPSQNPFYLDLPFDDLNDTAAFKRRCSVVPWAGAAEYVGHSTDLNFSYMKNRWVKMTGNAGQVCYGQIEVAGPGQYIDAAYVFGTNNARLLNEKYGGAGMEVSPALNSCLGAKGLNGDTDRLSWQFVDASDVPPGPWKNLVTAGGFFNR